MYIRRLDLMAFGPFTNQSLDFTPGLNIVYGDNEAGKSTTLRALRQLLFGFDHRCVDGYRHDNQKLRIGAVLEDGDRILEIIRRKSRGDTLRAADDQTVVTEEELESFLDRISAAEFQQRFGIDYQQLVTGGKEICEGGGDLGEMLFSAASGVADLRQVQQDLADQAGELYKPSGSRPALNQALAQHKALRRQIKQLQLLSSEWEQHEKSLQQAKRQLEEVLENLREKSSRKRRLEQLKSALPKVAHRGKLLEQLVPLERIPRLPDDFSTRREAAVREFQLARGELETLTRQLEERQKQRGSLEVPDLLLQHAEEIDQLRIAFGAYHKARQDRPKLEAKLREWERQACRILEDIGREPAGDAHPIQTVTRQFQTRLKRLARNRVAWQQDQNNLARKESQLRAELEKLREEQKALGPLPDPQQLKWSIQNLPAGENLERDIRQLEQQLHQAGEDFQATRHRLQLPDLPPREIEQIPLPSLATIQRFEDDWKQLRTLLGHHDQQIEQHDQKIRQLRNDLEKERAEQRVPTEAELQQCRREREEAWAPFRQVWLGKRLPGPEEAAERLTLFEQFVQQADTMADQMRRQADVVARQDQWLRTCDDYQREKALHEQQRETAREELGRLEADWQDLWKSLGVVLLPPREMRDWTEKVHRLMEDARQLRQKELEHQSLLQRKTTAVEQLWKGLRESGMEGDFAPRSQLPTDDLGALLKISRDGIERAEELARKASRLKDRELQNAQELEQTRRELEQAAEEGKAWQAEWSECMETLQLAASTSPDEAQTVLDTLQELQQAQRNAETERERIQGIDQEAAAFLDQLRDILEKVANDLIGEPVDDAMTGLARRHQEAITLSTQRKSLDAQLEEDLLRRDKLRQRVHSATVELELLRGEAECESNDQLPAIERLAVQRRETEKRLEELEQDLLYLAEGIPLEEFIQQTETCQPEELQGEIDHLQQELDQGTLERDRLNETVGAETTRLATMNGGAEAAEAEAELAGLQAKIESDVEHYARLKLAAAILRDTIERYREKNQTPVLQRAGQLFQHLTRGNFTGLRAMLTGKGERIMQGVRPDGEFLEVDGMSDGASDQLYLALRVASLEHYFQENKSIPFIVDDVLVMFDDDRAAAALQVFSELAESCQVIFFTHHRHLLQLAELHLPAGSHVVHHLGEVVG